MNKKESNERIRDALAEEIMDMICEKCHQPHVLDEDALPAMCEECNIYSKLRLLV